jgi:outer membrane receptor protein involved in Fe transport
MNTPTLSPVPGLPAAISLLVLGAFAAVTASGQNTANDTAAEEIVELSPFEVTAEKDLGYRAGTSMAGTRTNEELKNVPAAITVFTDEFISDIGATDLASMMEYAIVGDVTPTTDDDYNTTRIRGYSVPYNRRNYFIWTARTDVYNTERLDIARGPNGVLFGDVDPGGIANTNTKRAKFKNATSAAVRAGSNQYFRATLDINRVVTKNWALRLNVLEHESDSYVNWVYDKRRAAHLASTLRLGRDTVFRVEGEYGMFDRNFPSSLPRDRYSVWDGVTTYESDPSNAAFARQSTAAYRTWFPELNSVLNLQGSGRTNGGSGAAAKAILDQGIFPRDFHIKGADQKQENKYHNYSAYLERRFGRNLVFEIAYNRSVSDDDRITPNATMWTFQDPNAYLPDGVTPNDYFGYHFYDQGWAKRHNREDVQDARASMVFDWRAGNWMQQRFFASAGWRNSRTEDRSSREAWLNTGNPNMRNSSNYVWRRVYFELGDSYENTAFKGFINDPVTGLVSGFPNNGNLQNSDDTLQYAQVSATGNYWQGRLRTLVGVRRDKVYNKVQGYVEDAATGNRTPGDYRVGADMLKTSVNAGALFSPVPALTIFYSYSESFRPINSGLMNRYNMPLSPREGIGNEYGVRLELFNRKAYLTASYHDIDLRNVNVSISSVVGNINDIWEIVDPSRKLPDGFTPYDVRSQWARGVEVELWLNLTREWSVQAGFATTNNKFQDVANDIKNYTATHMESWVQAAGDNPAIIGELDGIYTFLNDNTPGAMANRSNKWKFTAFTKYQFRRGPLKGFYLGGGVVSTSGRVLYNEVHDGEIVTYWGPGYTIINALAGYSRKIGRRTTWKVALNVNNLTDREYVNQTSLDSIYWGAPRTFMLTNTFSF